MKNVFDKRWSIAKEYCGYNTKRYVIRFCGEWIGQTEHKEEAQIMVRNCQRTLAVNNA